MKILVRDEGQSALGAIQVKIKDLSSELEKVTVRILRLGALEQKILNVEDILRSKASGTPRKPAKVIPVTDANPSPQPNPVPPTKTVELVLSLPSLHLSIPYKKLKKRIQDLPKPVFICLGVVCIGLIAVGVYDFHHPTHHTVSSPTTGQNSQVLVRGTPSYATLLPAGKNITDLGGWTRISPPNRDPVYTYVDRIGSTKITVSEQPLPANFMNNTASQVQQLATNFSATEKFTAGGTTVYIGTSAQGPQSVILSKNNLLILIKSASVLPINQWTAYINSLQ